MISRMSRVFRKSGTPKRGLENEETSKSVALDPALALDPAPAPNPNQARTPRRKHKRRHPRSCSSRHSMVLGYDGFPAAPPRCSALPDIEADPEKDMLTQESNTELVESNSFTVTLPYPFSIDTILGSQPPTGGVIGKADTVLSNCTEELSIHTTSVDVNVNAMDAFFPYSPKYTKYERLLGRYWMEEDYDGNTRMERWVDEQMNVTIRYNLMKAKEREERRLQREERHLQRRGI